MEKVCYKCGVTKPIDYFRIDNSIKSGRSRTCKSCVNKHSKSYYNQRSSCDIDWKSKRSNSTKRWRSQNRQAHNTYQRTRNARNLTARLFRNVNRAILASLRGEYKSESTIRLLGCTIKEFKKHLESQFQPGMTWENYGNGENRWNIDHLIPTSWINAYDADHLRLVSHRWNMRPMWSQDNSKRGNLLR